MNHDSSDDKGESPQQALQDYVDLMFMGDSLRGPRTESAGDAGQPKEAQSSSDILHSTQPGSLQRKTQSQKKPQGQKNPQENRAVFNSESLRTAETDIVRSDKPVLSTRSDTPLTSPTRARPVSSVPTTKPAAHGKPVKDFEEDSVDWQLIRDRVKKLTQRLPEPAKKETLHAPQSREVLTSPSKPAVHSATTESQTEQKTRRHIAQTQKKKEATVSVSSSIDQKPSTPLVDSKAVTEKRVNSDQVSRDIVTGSDAQSLELDALDPAALDAGNSPSNAWCENGRPTWAQEDFECLLFKVSGLTMAVPLVELGSIFPVNDELTPIFGQIDWFVGLLPVKKSNVRVVNTAKVVMPERYNPQFTESFRYVISINGYDWGLAVDCVDKAITLEPAAVRWRTKRSKRPWLAGTVVDYMCALVDVQTMAVMFDKADRHNRH